MNKKPFVVIHDKKNNVILLDNIENRQLLFFQFNNYKDADDCRKGLMHLCNPMNRVAEENYSLKKLLDDTSVDRLAKENQKLKNENQVLKQFINDVFDLLDKNILEAEDMVKWSDEKGLRYTNVSWSFLLKTLKLMKKGMSLEGNLLISDETLE